MTAITQVNIIPSSEDFKYQNRYIFLVATVTALGGLLFGYDIANISGTIHFFTSYFSLNEYEVGWAVGCISVGAAVGALIAGRLSDIYGRKKVLLWAALLFAITGVGTGWAENFILFIIFRIISGVAIGCATVLCPMYIAEISPARYRGKLVAYYQLAITLGVLLAYLSNYLLLNTGENNWRWMFSSQSVPAVLFFAGLFLVPESPRWLIMVGREKEARSILEKVGGIFFAEVEAGAIEASFFGKVKENFSQLFDPRYRTIIITGIGIAVFSQVGGPFTAYAPEIFKDAGIMQDSAFLQSIIIGFILFLFTLVAIATVEKAGRRDLLLYGAASLLLISVAVAIAFYYHIPGIWILIFALINTAVYAATVGPVSWVVLSEIFPNRIRGSAMSLATVTLWVANFLNTASFPIIRAKFGMSAAFGIYAPLFLIFLVFVYRRVPETKGKSLEQIEKMLTPKPAGSTPESGN